MAENGSESDIDSQENLAIDAINLEIDEVPVKMFSQTLYFSLST